MEMQTGSGGMYPKPSYVSLLVAFNGSFPGVDNLLGLYPNFKITYKNLE